MDTGTYSAANALVAYMRAQEVIAHNLANVNTPGFRRRVPQYEPFQQQLDAATAEQTGATVEEAAVDFARGSLDQTGSPLDLALDCEGFFLLRGPEGPVYTRKGTFTLDASGRVVDTVGRPLLAEGGGELTVPAETSAIRVDGEGRLFADDTEVGKIWVADVPDRSVLVPAAYTAFALPPDGPAPQTVDRAVVVQGALETSNTNPVDELVTMISVLRSFEAAQRALTSMDETTEQLATAAQSSSS